MLSIIETAAARAGKKIQVLFLGNSYTSVNNLPLMISNLASAAGDTLVFESNLPGGYTFQNHYSNNTSKALIKSRHWDYVEAPGTKSGNLLFHPIRWHFRHCLMPLG
ncbi:hypothetical protein MASR1M65_27280 [Saprospiraceae bacterium]